MGPPFPAYIYYIWYGIERGPLKKGTKTKGTGAKK
jgi:hypothetical protein